MNSEICFDACRNIYGKSSSTFWSIFIKIPKLIPRVATVMHMHYFFSATLTITIVALSWEGFM